MPRPRSKYWQFASQPAARTPPFLLVREDESLVLVAPFAKRKRGPTPEEAALVKAVAACLESLPAAGNSWIDPVDGSATPAAIGEGQLRRRLIDNASFDIRFA